MSTPLIVTNANALRSRIAELSKTLTYAASTTGTPNEAQTLAVLNPLRLAELSELTKLKTLLAVIEESAEFTAGN